MRHLRPSGGGKAVSNAGRSTDALGASETSQEVSHLVDRLEEIAAWEECGSRPTFIEAQKLRSDLVVACGTDLNLRDLRRRGVLAFKSIHEKRSAATEREKAARAENATTKRRIIAAIDAATTSGDPARFIDAVEDICRLYRETPSAGADNAALGEQFRVALLAFRAVIKGQRPASV